MKNMRKLFAVALAIMMVMSLATTAFATGDTETTTTYTLTLNGAQAGHTYTVYQIFKGDLKTETTGEGEDAKTTNTLSNITWGDGVTEAGQTALETAYTADGAEATATAADIAASLTNTELAEGFAAKVAEYLGTAAGSVEIADNATSGTISNLAAGYYLVKTTKTTEENGVLTYYIMKVVADTTASIKAAVPEIEKTVNDNDVSIGDTVTFTLTATMPSNLDGYDAYKVIFHDTLSAGLTYGSITSVTVGTIELTSDQYSVSSVAVTKDGEPTGETELTVTIDDVLTYSKATGTKIVVTYTATLDSDAVIGSEGNPNTVYLEYSNNPNGEGTGKTPPKDVEVYTWSLKVTKVDGNNAALSGAGFTLYDAEGNEIKLTQVEGTTTYKVDPNGSVTEITTDATGVFTIEGLESATYTLKETTTPAGYNTAADTEVTINGTTTAVAEVTVTNYAGSTLPETGGIGTTLFYVIGGIMVLAAVILLVTKRRMSVAE